MDSFKNVNEMEADHYSSEEEEVFFGSLAETEVSKRQHFLGANYNSPITPRPPRFNQAVSRVQGCLPDVLGLSSTSTPVQKQLSSASSSNDQQSTHIASNDSSPNESNDVIILDSTRNSDSVIILSDDDESFVRNEEACVQVSARDAGDENEKIVKEPESISKFSGEDETTEAIEKDNGSFTCDKEIVTESVLAESQRHHKSQIDNFENKSFNRSLKNVKTNSLDLIADKSCDFNIDSDSCSLVQDINDFVGDSDILEKCSANINNCHSPVTSNYPESSNFSCNQSVSEEKSTEILSCIATEATSSVELAKQPENTNNAVDISDNTAIKHSKCSFLHMSDLSDLDYSLSGTTDSVLNISHGSSLPSPPNTQQAASFSCPKPNLYEDISCEGEQLDDINGTSNVTKTNLGNEDLHMSVDEVDFQQETCGSFVASSSLETPTNISQPSEYKSCPSGYSSYSSAYDITCENHSTSEQFDSFQNYRDVSSDLNMSDIRVAAVSIKSDEENVNETSFEMVMQNRQNSFNGATSFKRSENSKEEIKPKAVSKLPVYQNSKGLLKPPKFYIKPDMLKTSSFKFAKQISKVESEKSPLKIPKPGLLKLSGPKDLSLKKHADAVVVKENKPPTEKERTFTKTPAKVTSPKPNMLTKSKTPIQTSGLSRIKTPSYSNLSLNKTPTLNIMSKPLALNKVSKTPAIYSTTNKTPSHNISGIPRAVKSDSKVMRTLTPVSNCNSSEKSVGRSILNKNRYKNVTSPIQAYIKGSPITQRKAQVLVEEHVVFSPDGEKVYESVSQKVTPGQSRMVPKAVQQLKYESIEGQENVNPNVLHPCRDTIPSKMIETSLEVFWKEQEQPQSNLPKMGEKQTKILGGPTPFKVTSHQGRVSQPPHSKGVLVRNDESPVPAMSDDVNTDHLQPRISVRVRKPVELPKL